MKTIRSIFHHLKDQPFVTAAALAALVHSCWTFSVFFAGDPPNGDNAAYLGWLIPGVLLALAIDVGLLSVSIELREKGSSFARIVTFGFLSVFMGYAQFLFSISHAPHIPISAGVRSEWIGFVELLRDLEIFVLPLMLPIAITLHSLGRSGSGVQSVAQQAVVQVYHDELTKPLTRPTPAPTAEELLDIENWPAKQPTQDYRTMLDLDAAIEGYFEGKPMTEDEMFANSPDTRREVEEERQRARTEGRPMFNNPALADDSRPLGSSPSSNGHRRDDAPIVEE